jgi:hypothetical protein
MAVSERWNRDQIRRLLEELSADASFSVRVAARAGL